jgi:hypothetical protein
MEMNRLRFFILWIACSILGIMILIVPWRYHIQIPRVDINISVPGPYRLIFLGSPAIPIDRHENIEDYFLNYPHSAWKAEVDWPRLVFPTIFIILISSCLLISIGMIKNNHNKRSQT